MGTVFQQSEEVVQTGISPPREAGAGDEKPFRNDELAASVALAQFKLALIMPAYQRLHDCKSDTKYFEQLSRHELTLPDGTKKKYRPKTFQKWLELYRKHGIKALMPGVRSDKGRSRVLDEEAIRELIRVKEEHPKLNATQLHDYLVRNGFVPACTSLSTVQRFIKANNLKGEADAEVRDRKAFEEDAFGKLWQADTCQLCMIESGGSYKWVYVMGIIDDHSRVIVGVECFYHDNAVNFQKVFRESILRFGIPAMLLCDNGAPYSNEQLSLICGNIGTALIHLRPRDGAGKGKIERWWKSLQSGLLAWLNTQAIHSCEEMTDKVREWARDYNLRVHSGIGCAPMGRYESSKEKYVVRRAESMEWLTECFHNRIRRKVRKDCTLSINCVSYDVPPQFARLKVEVRFVPDHIAETAYIFAGGEKYPIRPTDKNENCHTRRRKVPAIDYSKI